MNSHISTNSHISINSHISVNSRISLCSHTYVNSHILLRITFSALFQIIFYLVFRLSFKLSEVEMNSVTSPLMIWSFWVWKLVNLNHLKLNQPQPQVQPRLQPLKYQVHLLQRNRLGVSVKAILKL